MKTKQFFTLKEVKLNNNCPECYSNEGLKLTFKQKIADTLFYKAITEHTTLAMYCTICKTDIFPVRWTNEIEQVVAYQQRAIKPKSKSIKLKKLAWILIVIITASIIGVILFISGVFE
ncbi:hypothetical protein [Ichthyenterobacterium magnum]|uniref:Zinc ribbon family protein n=1 Tax=Ichthyenterobacterium magnum TaxID=1230530 RepID=A0A420DWG7_9FLAO|nr:hypothetical protein [Ichthyenterobacterium magnum]RKE98531.1 hypothetical protein BXY80_0620 [Ichthyenterobacterium magnum]